METFSFADDIFFLKLVIAFLVSSSIVSSKVIAEKFIILAKYFRFLYQHVAGF